MRVIYTFALTLFLIYNYTECSSKTNRNPKTKRYTGPPSPGSNLFLLAECCSQIDGNLNSVNDPGSSSSSRPQHRSSPTPSEETPVRARSRSPDRWSPSTKILGYSLGQLGYLRLIPHTNHNLEFQFRRYVFTDIRPVRLREEQGRYYPMRNGENIVVSTSDGDALAILESSGILRGMFSTNRSHSRMKLNMTSGTFEKMTADEIRDCPAGRQNIMFPKSFMKSFANVDSLQDICNPHSELQDSSYRDRPISSPGRPPSHGVLGYSLEKLGYIRLIPQENQNRRFEFRRYVIPADKPLRLQFERTYMPLPIREYIVLSTSNGDVFAILEYTGILRGIYTTRSSHARMKINMINGVVKNMAVSEMRECHVGIQYPIFPRWFTEEVSDEDSLQKVYH